MTVGTVGRTPSRPPLPVTHPRSSPHPTMSSPPSRTTAAGPTATRPTLGPACSRSPATGSRSSQPTPTPACSSPCPSPACRSTPTGSWPTPTEWNRNDGFSPGTALLTQVPGLDVEASDLPAITDIPDSLAEDSPVVVVDMDTGERQPVWAELDSGAEADEDRLLFIRPGVNYLEGHHYVVGLRDLVGTDGEALEPSPGFLVYRDNLSTDLPVIEDRREPMERVFGALALAGVPRQDLYLAWDFTVASERNLSERLLHIRDDAFADLGAGRPRVHRGRRRPVDPGGGRASRYIHGTFQVPLYLTGDGARRHSVRQRRRTGCPSATATSPPTSSAPYPTPRPTQPAPMSLYGHGLLGSRDEVEAGNIADSCASTTWSSAPPTGSACPRTTSPTRRRSWPAREVPDAGRPLPAGDPEHPVPGPADAARGRPDQRRRVPGRRRRPAARHQRAVLRRQQPGRDHRRGGHRGGPGLDPRRARRARHELLAAPAAAAWTSTPMPPSSTRPTRTRSSRTWGCRSSRCSGTGPRTTATPST